MGDKPDSYVHLPFCLNAFDSIQNWPDSEAKALHDYWKSLQDLDLVQGFAPFFPDLFKVAGGQPGHLLKLIAQVGDTGVIELVGNFTQGQFIIDQEFLYPFDLLGDKILFDRGSFHLRKEIGHSMVVMVQPAT